MSYTDQIVNLANGKLANSGIPVGIAESNSLYSETLKLVLVDELMTIRKMVEGDVENSILAVIQRQAFEEYIKYCKTERINKTPEEFFEDFFKINNIDDAIDFDINDDEEEVQGGFATDTFEDDLEDVEDSGEESDDSSSSSSSGDIPEKPKPSWKDNIRIVSVGGSLPSKPLVEEEENSDKSWGSPDFPQSTAWSSVNSEPIRSAESLPEGPGDEPDPDLPLLEEPDDDELGIDPVNEDINEEMEEDEDVYEDDVEGPEEESYDDPEHDDEEEWTEDSNDSTPVVPTFTPSAPKPSGIGNPPSAGITPSGSPRSIGKPGGFTPVGATPPIGGPGRFSPPKPGGLNSPAPGVPGLTPPAVMTTPAEVQMFNEGVNKTYDMIRSRLLNAKKEENR